MGWLEERDAGHLPSDEVLEAFRLGHLSEEECQALERWLGRDGAARARLAQLGGVRAEGPAPWVRDAVLSAFGGSPDRPERVSRAAKGETPRRSGRPGRRAGWGGWGRWAATAVLAAGLATVLVWTTMGPTALPTGLAYQVQGTGLAETRSVQAASPVLKALPDTLVRIVVTPVDVAEKDVKFALFRRRGELVELLPTGSDIRLRVDRGTAVFEARAEDLVGRDVGEHTLYVVVARPGDLPAPSLTISDESIESLLAEGGRRLVYHQPLQLVDEYR
ncbi:MAG: hypothetical protein KDD11_05910 [Acidobacteria bacterium]|nr:hypothetical protein [Acidobacteriota bacterium]